MVFSVPFQFFPGTMETLAGLLLLYRRTVTAGLFAATGAFLNVLMINLSYDVPVKLYASHLLLACLFLLALDAPRLVRLLVLNQPVPATTAYDPKLAYAWQRWGSIGVKIFLVYEFLLRPAHRRWAAYQSVNATQAAGPFTRGFYDVGAYVVNRDTITVLSGDKLRWRDVIIYNTGVGIHK